MSDIREIWKTQSVSHTSQVVIKEKIEEVAGLDCFVGTIGMSGAKVFILKLDNDIKVHQNKISLIKKIEGLT